MMFPENELPLESAPDSASVCVRLPDSTELEVMEAASKPVNRPARELDDAIVPTRFLDTLSTAAPNAESLVIAPAKSGSLSAPAKVELLARAPATSACVAAANALEDAMLPASGCARESAPEKLLELAIRPMKAPGTVTTPENVESDANPPTSAWVCVRLPANALELAIPAIISRVTVSAPASALELAMVLAMPYAWTMAPEKLELLAMVAASACVCVRRAAKAELLAIEAAICLAS